MLKLFFLFQLCGTCLFIQGQPTPSRYLGIGDTLPNMALGYAMTDSNRAIQASDLKGRLTILDFWDGGCSACFKEMPHLDSLQQQFNGQVRIILITRSAASEVTALFRKVKLKQPRLDMINGDRVMHALFPFNTVPHHVWIDTAGIIRFVTGGNSTTATHIAQFLAGKLLDLAYKKEWPDFDAQQPLLQEGQGRLIPHLQAYSLLMDKVEFGGGTYLARIDNAEKQVHVKIINQSLLFLYRFAFSGAWNGGVFRRDDRVVLAVKDQSPFGLTAGTDRANQMAYFCYELSMPYSVQHPFLRRIQTDLNAYLPYTAALQKRKIPCWVLAPIAGAARPKSGNAPARLEQVQNTWLFQNQPVSVVVDLLPDLFRFFDAPFVDGTGCKGNINLRLSTQISGITDLRNALKPFGLTLVKQDRLLEVLYITDKG